MLARSPGARAYHIVFFFAGRALGARFLRAPLALCTPPLVFCVNGKSRLQVISLSHAFTPSPSPIDTWYLPCLKAPRCAESGFDIGLDIGPGVRRHPYDQILRSDRGQAGDGGPFVSSRDLDQQASARYFTYRMIDSSPPPPPPALVIICILWNRDLRGFVQSILHDDDGLAVLAEGGEKEMTRYDTSGSGVNRHPLQCRNNLVLCSRVCVHAGLALFACFW